MRTLAIDPGFSGAIYCAGEFWRMPVIQVRKRRDLDCAKLREIIITAKPDLVILERQMVMKGQGLSSSGSIMRQWGLLEGILIGLGLRYSETTGASWRRALKLPPPKAASLQALQRADPALAAKLVKLPQDVRIAVADCWCMIRAAGFTDDWLS